MGSETRTYNAMGQLTNITVPGSMNITYNYSPTQNNGKITSQVDSLTGEQVTYAYDSLNRLISAQAGTSWGQGFVYDPFGNLTDKNVLAGSAPPLHVVINAANNHAGGEDLNGNAGGVTWDMENRMTSVPQRPQTVNITYSLSYAYDGQNKRIWGNTPTFDQISGNISDSERYYFYGADGKLMAQFTPVYSPRAIGAPASLTWQNGPARVYFGSRLLGNEDRVGSRGKYFPYGEERNSPAISNDQVKFATYTRDGATGLDYADQRYYSSTPGRFLTPDPYRATTGSVNNPANPQSWNKYLYVLGDPINYYDPKGLFIAAPPPAPVREPDPPDEPEPVPGPPPQGQPAPTPQSKARENANNALYLFISIQFSIDCTNFLLNTLGLEISDVQGMAAGASVADASTVTTPAGVTLFPNDPALAAQQQSTADKSTGHAGTTLSQWFAANPLVRAATQFSGNTIYYNVNWWETIGSGMAVYTIFHETLHMFGMGDTFIETAFGISPTLVGQQGSQSITNKLMQECGR
jgi:RHS repeat-associated protein